MSLSDSAFCRKLPKTELHAHLTGSILDDVLHKIWQQHKEQDPEFDVEDPLIKLPSSRGKMDATEFFNMFGEFIYKLVDRESYVQQGTAAVLSDFHADGVEYLELRTIPRAAPENGLSKEGYVQTVLGVINSDARQPARTYLILGIDRKHTLAEAEEIVDLAIKYKSRGVVGVDLCGNPNRSDVTIFGPAYARAKAAGLRITLHFAEMEFSSHEAELRSLLSYKPDRLGHVIRVPAWAKQEIQAKNIGLELCLTCNVTMGLTSDGFSKHHFGFWRDKGCPIAICTDDVGIFGSRTSQEYQLLLEHFGLSRKAIVDVARSAVDCIFGTDEDRMVLRARLDAFEREMDF